MIQKINVAEISFVVGGINIVECKCLDINRQLMSAQKAKDKYDCWKICCKDSVPQVYAQYSEFEGTCMLEKEYLNFLRWKNENKNNAEEHKGADVL